MKSMLDDQMNKMLAEGGVMQEGGTVDPVSGNEVPVGAMQEEVRDDIDAKLSEGEFVFPADVVRFYGLEKLMMMRDKAKKGLQRMNDIGQMGNAEEVEDGEALFGDEEMDDDIFSSEIDSIMSEENDQEYAKGGDVRKYAEGGYVGGAANAQLYRDAPIRGFEMVAVTNDAGQTIYIPYINGVAQLPVPPGYKVRSTNAFAESPTSTQPVSLPSSDGGDSGGDVGGNVSSPTNTDDAGLATGTTVSPTTVGVIGAVMGMMGIPGATAVAAGKSSIANALSGLSAGQAAASNQAAMATAMGLTPAEAATTTGIAATASAVDSLSSAPTGQQSATPGNEGTGGSAASAASSAAAAAAAAGHSDAAIGAASQAAASATVSGASSSAAAAAGADAANATDSAANAASASVAADAMGDGIGIGDSGGIGVGDSGGGDSGAGAGTGNAMAKGGFVSKKKTKTISKPTSLASRRN
jgi:hypothetical protein